MNSPKLQSFSQLFSQSFKLYQRKLQTLAVIFVLPFAADLIVRLRTTGNTNLMHSFNSGTLTVTNSRSFDAIGLVVAVITFVVSVWVQAAAVYSIDDGDGRTSATVALGKGWSLIGPLLLVSILTGLAAAGGFILLIIPGFIFLIWFYFSNLELLLDGVHGAAALTASKALVKDRWGAVAGRLVLLGLSLIAISVVLSIPGAILGSVLRPIGDIWLSAASAFVVSPLAVIFSYLLYKDLKANPATAAATLVQPQA